MPFYSRWTRMTYFGSTHLCPPVRSNRTCSCSYCHTELSPAVRLFLSRPLTAHRMTVTLWTEQQTTVYQDNGKRLATNDEQFISAVFVSSRRHRFLGKLNYVHCLTFPHTYILSWTCMSEGLQIFHILQSLSWCWPYVLNTSEICLCLPLRDFCFVCCTLLVFFCFEFFKLFIVLMPDHLNCIFSVDLYSGLMSKLCLRLLCCFYVHLLQYFIQYSSNMFIYTCLGTICEYLVRNDSSIVASDTVLFLHCTSICQEVGKKNVSQDSWPLACNSKSGPSVCRHSAPYVYISGRSGASGAECACGQLLSALYRGVKVKFKLQHAGTWSAAVRPLHRLCHRPAVFFRRLCLIALSTPRETIRRSFQNCYYFILFYFLLF